MPSQNTAPDPGNTNSTTPHTIRWALAALGGALLCLQLLLCERVSFDEFRFSALCAAAFGFLIWPRRNALAVESGPISSVVGFALIAFFLVRSSGQSGTLFATVAPVIWGTGFALVASGFGGLRQYWRESLVLGAVVVTPFVDTIALDLAGVDLAPTTARAAATLLRLGGWDASARDVLVGLPTVWVVVSQGCSGLKTMYFLGGFSILILLMFPVSGLLRKIAVVAMAIGIGFFVNTLRVSLLALLADPAHHRAFLFWHIQQGAMLFEVIAIVAFLGCFYVLIPVRRAKPKSPLPSSA